MKTKKKAKGTKARVQAYKKRLFYIGTVITIAILIVIVALSSFLIYFSLDASLNQTTDSDRTNNQRFKLKAAIVDHLSLSTPNQSFIEKASTILRQAGYTVDYYSGEEVTVEFYRNLPTYGYSLVILRVHSARGDTSLSLFTSEQYSTRRYVYEQLDEQITAVGFTPYTEGDPLYFGIGPRFIKLSMKGRFQNTLIVMMGCFGLTYSEMAESFTQKGAKVYISWSGDVLGIRNDPAIACLLQHLILEKQTVEKAVADTEKAFGPSPLDDSVLLYYPLEAGNYTIGSS